MGAWLKVVASLLGYFRGFCGLPSAVRGASTTFAVMIQTKAVAPPEGPPPKKAKTDGGVSLDSQMRAASAACGANKTMMLAIPDTVPFRPVAPTSAEILAGRAPSVLTFMHSLYRSVVSDLSLFLWDNGQVKLREPLYMQTCPEFTSTAGSDADSAVPTTFKEPWNMVNCIKSLRQNGVYEATSTVWQFNPVAETWGDEELIPNEPSWHQYQACLGHWSEENLRNSSENEEQRRYIFPGFVPTCVGDIDKISEYAARNSTFRDLPACGAHSFLWSLFGAIDDAIHAQPRQERRVLKLYEASLTVTVRMRVSPSGTQLTLDRLSFHDMIRVQGVAANVSSFFEFVVNIVALPVVSIDDSGAKIVEKLSGLGVQYKGKPIDRNLSFAIQSVMTFACDASAKDAVRFVERVSPRVFADHTKLMRCCQHLKKTASFYEWMEMFVFVFESVGVALLSGDAKEEDFTVEFLVGTRASRAGHWQTNATKKKFIKWFCNDQLHAACGAGSAVTLEGVDAMKRTFTSPKAFFQKFARERTAEETDDCTLFDLAGDAVKAHIEGQTWTDSEKMAADLIAKVYMNQFEEELSAMASQPVAFGQYFGEGGLDTDSTGLRDAYADYKKSLRQVPVSADEKPLDPFEPIPGDVESEYKATLYKRIVSKRKEKVIFYHLKKWTDATDVWKKGGKVAEIFQKSKFIQAKKGDPGKKNSMMMMSASLFPTAAAFGDPKAHKESIVQYTDDMGRAFKWMASARGPNTVVLVSDGRSKKVRKNLEEILVEVESNEQKQLDAVILYREPPAGDIRFGKRRVFGGLNNRETLLGMLPVGKTRMKSVPREHFSACGECSTYSTSYSNVAFRPLKRLPRISLAAKECITGVTPPTYPEEIIAATGSKGHPLFWGETDDVTVFLALFKDLLIDDVLDLTPGSGAAACAACVLGISYEAIAMSENHKHWLDNIMDKTIFAIIADEDLFKADELTYVHTFIEEGRMFYHPDAGDDAASEPESEAQSEDGGDADSNA